MCVLGGVSGFIMELMGFCLPSNRSITSEALECHGSGADSKWKMGKDIFSFLCC